MDENKAERTSMSVGDASRDGEKENPKDAKVDDAKDKAEKPNIDPKVSAANYVRILSFGDRLDYLLMTLCLIAGVGSGIAQPFMFLIFGRLVGVFTSYFTPEATTTEDEFMHAVVQNALYMVYIAIARFVMSYVSLLTIRMSGLRISAKLRLAYLGALFRQPVSEIDTTPAGTIASRLTTSANTIQLGISQQFAMAIQALSFTIGLYVVSFIKSALLTLVASAALPVMLIAYLSAVPFFMKYYNQSLKAKDAASSLAFEIFASIRIVTAFGAADRLARQHKSFMLEARKAEIKSAPWMGIILSPMFFATYASFALVFWFGIRQVTRGHIDGIGSIASKVLFSVMFAVTSLGRVVTPIMAMGKAATAATEIFATIDREVPDRSGKKDPDVSPSEDIVFRNVTFSYPTRPDAVVLDRFSATFEKGKATAIVGPSGSGKSTIVGLLERWYEPNDESNSKGGTEGEPTQADPSTQTKSKEIEKVEGQGIEKIDTASQYTDEESGIFVGGINLNCIDGKWWRCNVGLVMQEPFLFNDTVFNNVSFGLCGTKWEGASQDEKMALVESACKESYCHDFVTKLPKGYDTLVGESGTKLSGGQRQRLAIARAIIKQPPILILDEATSSIDVRTEKIVQKALDKVSAGRTTITIAHRLSTIKRADKILVLRLGKLVEEGTHSSLLDIEDGIYAGLVRAQELVMGEEEDAETEMLEEDNEPEYEEEKEDIRSVRSSKRLKPKRMITASQLMWSVGQLLYEQRRRWYLYIFVILGATGAAAAQPIQSWLFAKLVEVFTLTGSKLVERGNFWAMIFTFLAVAVGVSYFMIGWSSHLTSAIVSSFYRQQYLESILKKRIEFFDAEEHSAGTLTSSVSTDPTKIEAMLGTEMALGLSSILNIIGSIIISFVFGWKLALVGVLAIMPVVLIAGYFRLDLEKDFERLNNEVFAKSSQFGSEAIAAFRTVTSMTMEDTISSRFERLLDEHVSTAWRRAKWSCIAFAFSDSADMFCQPLMFWYGGKLLAERSYYIVPYFVVYMSVIMSSQGAGMLFSFSPNVVEATGAANRIIGMRASPNGDESGSKKMPPSTGAVSIEFKNVRFSYTGREHIPVLKGIDLKIEAGQYAALVGGSGCGKSTIISLLEKFYDPRSGDILFGGESIAELDAASYRKNLSLVAQEPTLYEGTIRENIALSVETTLATDEAIETAARAAQIHDFVASLPDGYATRIGPKGVALSGGQRQRVALARALLRQPQLLLLDESTSNLDSESERLVQEAIERAAGEGGRTIVAVAHRLATVQKADVIFVIGSGRVLEQGSHRELVKKRGVYYQMCQAQALDR